MLIAEFAKATGLSRDTVRFYVKRGLLFPRVNGDGSNRYQHFDIADIERAAIIQGAQSMGFTLKEIVAFGEEFDSGRMTQERKIEVMQERIALVDVQLQKLAAMREYLARKVAWVEAGETGVAPLMNLAGALSLHQTVTSLAKQRDEKRAAQAPKAVSLKR